MSFVKKIEKNCAIWTWDEREMNDLKDAHLMPSYIVK